MIPHWGLILRPPEGKSKYSIGKEISGWVAKLFDATINPKTIAKRAERTAEKIATNVANPIPTEQSDKDQAEDESGEDWEWKVGHTALSRRKRYPL